MRALREGVGDHRETSWRTLCLLDLNQALGPRTGSELPNFQVGLVAPLNQLCIPSPGDRAPVSPSALSGYTSPHHGAEFPLPPKSQLTSQGLAGLGFPGRKVIVQLPKHFHIPGTFPGTPHSAQP